jgi:diaminohydroxyphosphoribosylaminopyrimidine deaminase / 5-amino-6-(5-phosphoribosylamino)uracil reductase
MPTRRPRSHESYMLEALRLARQHRTLPYPNPWVGCVIVKGEKIVGRGAHRGPGSNHAEVVALAQAGRLARNATLYVTLEPCCHFGRTPPCTNAILKAGIREIVYALRDPNPLVAGKSDGILRRQGLLVKSGVRAREAKALNEIYFKYRATSLPFVTLKVATSLDGKISTRTGESKWITGLPARERARSLRSRHQAVLVGVNTVLADNPHLGARVSGQPDPWRIVLDSSLRIPIQARVIQSRKCIVACTRRAERRKITNLEQCGAIVWAFRGRRVPLRTLLVRLAATGIISVLVEGGSEVLGSFFDQGLVDRVCWFLAPLVIGSARSRSAIAGRGVSRLADAWRLRDIRLELVGNSWMVWGNLSRWALALK